MFEKKEQQILDKTVENVHTVFPQKFCMLDDYCEKTCKFFPLLFTWWSERKERNNYSPEFYRLLTYEGECCSRINGVLRRKRLKGNFWKVNVNGCEPSYTWSMYIEEWVEWRWSYCVWICMWPWMSYRMQKQTPAPTVGAHCCRLTPVCS